MIFCKKKKIKVFHKMIAILIFQLFLFSSLGYIRPDHAFKNDTGTLRVPIGQAIDRMNYLSHDPAIRFQGVGLGNTKFNIEGHEVIIDLHIILNAALAYSMADSKNLKIEEVPIRSRYFDEVSTISLWSSIIYGFAILKTLLKYIIHMSTPCKFKQFL